MAEPQPEAAFTEGVGYANISAEKTALLSLNYFIIGSVIYDTSFLSKSSHLRRNHNA